MKIRLSEKIIIIISITLIITTSVSFAFIYNYASQRTRDGIIESSKLRAESISKDIKNIFENAALATNYLGQHDNIQAYLKSVKTREDILSSPYVDSVYKTMVDMSVSSENHFLVWVANEQANFYIDSLGFASGEDYDVRKRPWYDVAVNAEQVGLTPPYVEWETRQTVISSIKALYEDDEIYGFVAIDIVMKDIPDMINWMKQSDDDMSYLITDEGVYVYNEDETKIVNSNMFDENDMLSSYESHIRKGSGELLPIELEKKPYFLVSHLLDERNWKIVTLIDQDVVDENVNVLTRRMLVIFIIGLIIALILVYIQIKVTTNPFKHLVTYGQEIASGDFSHQIPTKYISRNDDMGDLSKSFQSITDTYKNINVKLEHEIKKKNAELESQFDMLVEQEKQIALGYMVSGVAHELNTPLGTCLSVSSFIENSSKGLKTKFYDGTLKKSDLEEYFNKQEEINSILLSSLDSANSIVKNFKMISIRKDDESKHQFKVLDLLNALGISMKIELDESEFVVTCDDNITIRSYPTALSNVLGHLIINSIKHGFINGPGRITVEVEDGKDYIDINYKDDGIGLSQEVIDKMYDMFYTTNRSSGSGGLGMYIVYTTITKKLKGMISFVGGVNEGVHFVIRIDKDPI